MAVIVWDQVGERSYELGLDRAVLYPYNNLIEVTSGEYIPVDLCPLGVPWNGMRGVEESQESIASNSYYFDGVKHFNFVTIGDFEAKLTAITYPEEFYVCDGYSEYAPGVYVDTQMPESFGLSYRTLLGNDVSGNDLGYKIHILYNLTAVSDSVAHKTIDSNVEPISFSWKISSVPEVFPGRRPTAHVILDSTTLLPEALSIIEGILYGTETESARLPTPLELLYYTGVTITDNGDGTWTAEGASYFIEMLDADTFQVDGATVVVLDANAYTIASTYEEIV